MRKKVPYFISLLLLCLAFKLSAKCNSYDINKQFSFFISTEDSGLKVHSPKRATIYSAVLPGLGQAYNKKYWKIPIIYVGIGVSGYFIMRNSAALKRYRSDIRALSDNDPNTEPTEHEGIGLDEAKQNRDIFKTYRDYSIIAMTALYALNIVDAAVDAHLYDFNINQKLSGTVKPVIYPTALGLSISVKF